MNVRVSLLDLAVLTQSLLEYTDKYEHADAERTLGELLRTLNKRVYVEKEVLESALHSANMLDEVGEFSHILDVGFQGLLLRLGPEWYERFNRVYNYLEESEDDLKARWKEVQSKRGSATGGGTR